MDYLQVERLMKCKTVEELKREFPHSVESKATTWDEFTLNASDGVIASADNRNKVVMEKWTKAKDEEVEAEWEHFKHNAQETPTETEKETVRQLMKSAFDAFRANYPADQQSTLIVNSIIEKETGEAQNLEMQNSK